MMKTSIDYHLIGKRIQLKRKQKKITQEQLASDVELSTFYISKIENGKVCPTLDTLAMIANYLEVDLNYLLTGSSILEKDYYLSRLENICKIASNKQLNLILKVASLIVEE